MLRLIVFIVIVFIISRLIDAARRRQINAQRRIQQIEEQKTKEIHEETRIIKVPKYDAENNHRSDDILQPSIIEAKSHDEETFDEESSETIQQSQVAKISQTSKKGPVMIAGIPINSKTIAQGIVISEILKRPDF